VPQLLATSKHPESPSKNSFCVRDAEPLGLASCTADCASVFALFLSVLNQLPTIVHVCVGVDQHAADDEVWAELVL